MCIRRQIKSKAKTKASRYHIYPCNSHKLYGKWPRWTTRRLWCGNILLPFVSSGIVYDSKSITCAQDCSLRERHKYHVPLTIWTREKRQESQVMFGLPTLLQYHGADFTTGAEGQFQSFASLRHLHRVRWIEAPANRLHSSSWFNCETRHPAQDCIDDIISGMTLATKVKPEDLHDRPPISDEMDSPLLFAIGID